MSSSKCVARFEMCLNQFDVVDNYFCVCCNVYLFSNPDIPKSELDYRCIFGFTSFLEIIFIAKGFLRYILSVADGC